MLAPPPPGEILDPPPINGRVKEFVTRGSDVHVATPGSTFAYRVLLK